MCATHVHGGGRNLPRMISGRRAGTTFLEDVCAGVDAGQLRKFIRKHRVRCGHCFPCRAACNDLASDSAVNCVELCRWQHEKALETVELAKKRTWNWHREIELCQRVKKEIPRWERHWEYESGKLYYGIMWERKYARASIICWVLQKPAAQVWLDVTRTSLHPPAPLEHSDAEIGEREISRSLSWPGAWPFTLERSDAEISEPGISRSLSWQAAWPFRGSMYESMKPIGMIHQEPESEIQDENIQMHCSFLSCE